MREWLKRAIMCVGAIGLLSPAYATPPQVTNVTAQQRAGTKLVDISYSLAADAPCRVFVRISINSGSTYAYTPAPGSMTGDIGMQVTAGAGKQIVWDLRPEYDWQYNESMRLKIIAEYGEGMPVPEDEFMTVPGGAFLIGRATEEGSGSSNEQPTAEVQVATFEISKCEITNAQYAEFLRAALAADQLYVSASYVYGKNGPWNGQRYCYFCTSGSSPNRISYSSGVFSVQNGYQAHPVNYVSWYGAMAFCQFYSTEGVIYDLPTEAEWEKAARGPDHGAAGTHQIYPWGNSVDGSDANYDGSGDPFSDGTTPVGYYNGAQEPAGGNMVNGYGLYDMAGNLWEWCRSGYSGYPYEATDSLDNRRNSLTYSWSLRVLRGGAWYYGTPYLRCAYRSSPGPASLDVCYGFRVVRRANSD